ncbi:hypothetical protein K449DRAFT_388130 [Hypoxylon sp. EC38]|nr:hypothetical protein K449DRAFT_388130 [Hypoxylon sp. EC38]
MAAIHWKRENRNVLAAPACGKRRSIVKAVKYALSVDEIGVGLCLSRHSVQCAYLNLSIVVLFLFLFSPSRQLAHSICFIVLFIRP